MITVFRSVCVPHNDFCSLPVVYYSCGFCGGDCFITDFQFFIEWWGYFVSAVHWKFWGLGPSEPARKTSCVNICHTQNVEIQSLQAETHNRVKQGTSKWTAPYLISYSLSHEQKLFRFLFGCV